jgi:glucokinase
MNAGLGVDAGGTLTKLVAVTGSGRLIGEGEFPTLPEEGPKAFVRRLSREVRSFERGLGADLKAVGMAIAGDVDPSAGRIRRSPNLSRFERFPLRDALRRALRRPVELHNDANMAAWGAYAVGSGRKKRHVAAITLGTGVGGGAVSDGKLLEGATGSALELGHTRVEFPGGRRCSCGARGHLEAYAGSYGILSLYREFSGRRVAEPKDVSEAAARGDRAARKAWRIAGEALAVGAANLVYLFNPDEIVFTGGVSRAGKLFLDPIRRAFKKESFRGPFGRVRLRVSRLKGLGALGAAAYALDAARA